MKNLKIKIIAYKLFLHFNLIGVGSSKKQERKKA